MGKKITSQRKHTRVKFSALDISCALSCITPQSPAAQTINTTLSPIEYEPDRSLSPTCILPEVRAVDTDGVFPYGNANSYLSKDTLQWHVDGKPIAEVWTEEDYDINKDEGDTRGMLTVKKNLPADSRAVLTFKAQFLDYRTNAVYTVESNELPLSCTDKGTDAYTCSVDKSEIVYDPVYDNLLLWEYKTARGLTNLFTEEEATDDRSYLQNITVTLINGHSNVTELSDGITMRLMKGGKEVTKENAEVLNVAYPSITLDMRLVDKEDYKVEFVNAGQVIASATITARTNVSLPTSAEPFSGADIVPSQETYANKAVLQLYGTAVNLYPELYYCIQWFTQSRSYDETNNKWDFSPVKQWQRGEYMNTEVKNLGIGSTYNDSCFDVYFDVTTHDVCGLVTDEEGNVLTDEEGNNLID